MPGRVAWIAYTVVKGLRLALPDAVELGRAGIADDRRFHLADARGRMFNGKRRGELALVSARLHDDHLTLVFPDGDVVSDPLTFAAGTVHTRFYGRPRPARETVGPWSDALSRYVGEPVTLRESATPAAGLDRGRDNAVSILSVAALGPAGAAAGAPGPLDPRRFRMTIGVDGVAASAEDGWLGERVRIGEAVVRPGMHVGRCLVTSQDPDTGRRDLDVLAALGTYRPDDLTAPLALGVAGKVLVPGRVALGDPVYADVS